MRRFTLLLVVLAMTTVPRFLFAQPDTIWTKTYGGTADDFGFSVVQTADGGYIVSGSTLSFGTGGDVFLVRTSTNGDPVWTLNYGGSSYDEGLSVIQTVDGGFATVGFTYSFGAGSQDVYLIRTDADGGVLGTRTYGGSSSDEGRSVIETADGGFAVAGNTYSFGAGLSDVYLIRTDANGDTLWTRTYGGSSYDKCYSAVQTGDGGFVMAGYTKSTGAGEEDVYLIRTDANGSLLWSQTYGGSEKDIGHSVAKVTGGGFIIAGYTYSYGAGGADVYLIRTNANGTPLWTQTYGSNVNDHGFSVAQTSDSSFVIAGNTIGAGGYDIYLIGTDTSGDTLWTQTFGRSSSEEGHSVARTADGGFIVGGYTRSFGAGEADALLIRFEGLYLTLGPAQIWVPRLGTLDFQVAYHNLAEDPFTIEVVFEAYRPGATDPNKTYSNIFTLEPDSTITRYYSLTVPSKAVLKPGYLLRAMIIDPPGSGEVVNEQIFEFEVKPAMESLPFELDFEFQEVWTE
jgi:hypothetical protein